MIWNWSIFIITCLLMVFVGFWSGRKVKGADTDEGYLLGGKQIGPFVGAAALVATGYSGWGFIGAPGTAYAYGTIELLANFLYAPAICFGTLWFANYLRKQAGDRGGLTIPEYLSRVHRGTDKEKRAVHFLAGIATLVFLTVYVVGQIRALGYTGSVWLNISEQLASILLMLVVLFIAVQGGRLGIAASNTIMCVGMLIAAAIVLYVIRADMSIGELFQRVAEIEPGMMNPQTSAPYGQGKYSVFLVFVYALLFTTCLPYMSSQFLTFSDKTKTHKVALYIAPMGLVLSVIPLVGLYMRIKNPGLAIADMSMPVFLNTFVSPKIGGLITLFIIFAMLSTVSAVVQTQAAALSYDIRSGLNMKEPKRGDLINRIAVIVIGVVSILLTYFAPQGMLNQFSYIGTGGLISMLFGPTIVQIFVKANARTCFWSMSVGLITNILLNTLTSAGWVEIPIIGAAVGGILYAVMGYITNGNKRIPDELEISTN